MDSYQAECVEVTKEANGKIKYVFTCDSIYSQGTFSLISSRDDLFRIGQSYTVNVTES